MSRYVLCHPQYEVVVGWDPPMGTYFAEVVAHPASAVEPISLLWVGTFPGALPTVARLQHALAPFATIPADVVALLQQEAPAPVHPLQQQMHRLWAYWGYSDVPGAFEAQKPGGQRGC